ncbi:MAG: tetratricopeptide repeat protein [Candidatus Scalindua sp.]|jgi:tetratricopeptide (TPR) repeat protein|nr:tetratricopeptide repeat protein [Candidatus Scalindua sp.]MDV5166875.1 tetratricopeptide repeat protein [Candidatus Scalindua sp.]
MRQKNILIIFILSFVFLFAGSYLADAFARDDQADTFFRANKEYSAGQKAMAERKKEDAVGKFEQAVSLYEQLLESGFINGQIYYNLGNAYYRLGAPGKAIMYYRRAEELLPRDADIKANINLLKRDFVDGETFGQKPEILKVACFWYFYLNLSEITSVTIYIYLALIASILSIIFLRQQWIRKIIIIFASCFLVLVISLGLKAYNQSVEMGVVIADESNIRYGPGAEYEPRFKIHEGAEVRIEEKKDKWYKVYVFVDVEDVHDDEGKKETESKTGWIPESEIGEI